jgi:hypothetical protein
MKWFTVTRIHEFPIHTAPEIAIQTVIQRFEQNFRNLGMDFSVHENAIDFAGNMMAFTHPPLNDISGDLEIAIENNRLVITYNLFYFGQFLLGLVLLLLSLFPVSQSAAAFPWLFRIGVIFILFTTFSGLNTFDDIVYRVGYGL